MTEAITAPAANQEFEQSDVQVIETEMSLNKDFETTQEVENEYFVLGYN